MYGNVILTPKNSVLPGSEFGIDAEVFGEKMCEHFEALREMTYSSPHVGQFPSFPAYL